MHDTEFFLLTKNAQEIPISLNASSFKDGDGSSRRIVVVMRDVSESKRAQEANSLLASIVDSSGDAIYSVSTELIITSWNPAAEALFGYSAAEAVGRSVALLVPLDRRAELAERIQRFARAGRWNTTRPCACARTAAPWKLPLLSRRSSTPRAPWWRCR